MSKIAILHPKATIRGGAIKTLFEIARILGSGGNEVSIMVLESDRKNCFPELNQGLEIRDLGGIGVARKIFAFLRMAFALRKYDAVIAGNSPMHFVSILAKIFHPKLKVFWYLQNLPVYYLESNRSFVTSVKKALERMILPFIDRIITNSTFIRDEVWKDFARTSEVLYPPVDTGFFSNGHQPLEENKTLFCYSRLAKGKNVALAIRTFIELQKKHPGIKLIIGGDGEEMETLQEMAQFHAEDIRFLGEISSEEVREHLQRCTAFLFTSLIDAFGLTILEAMSMGKGMVAMACGGATELIGHAENGFLAKTQEEFITLTDELLRDSEIRKKMGTRGREWALMHFSRESFAQRLYEILTPIVSICTKPTQMTRGETGETIETTR